MKTGPLIIEYRYWCLKIFDAHDLGIQNIRCLTQKIESRLEWR